MAHRYDNGSTIEMEEKALAEADDCWKFTGYAAVFNNRDLGGDVIVPGAFKKSLEDHGLPLLLFQHKMDECPVGTLTEAKEDKRGLWVKGELPKDDGFVRDRLVPQLKRRGIRGMSIGYKATDKEIRKSDGARMLKTIRLYEASFVSMPMNPEAGIESLKGYVPFQDLYIDREVKEWDSEATFKKLVEKFGDNVEDMRQCFLFADGDDPKAFDPRLLIADVDDRGRFATNRIALYKAAALFAGARGGVQLPEEAEIAVKMTLDRYYSKLNLESPFKSLSADEYEGLDTGELEARLKGLGVSRKLAKTITDLRDADRKTARSVQPGRMSDDAQALISALSSSLVEAVAAIKQR